MNKNIVGFIDFIREAGVVGLAIGLAIGTQVTLLVSQIVDNFINPIVGYVLSFIVGSGASLQDYTWTLASGNHPLVIGWGAIVSGLIKLVAIATVIYFIIIGLRLNKIDKAKK